MARGKTGFDDAELDELPQDLRWRKSMGRVEAVLFAAPEPVTREILARVVGETVAIEALIDDINAELRARPYEIVFVAGGWRFQSRAKFAPFIRGRRRARVGASERNADAGGDGDRLLPAAPPRRALPDPRPRNQPRCARHAARSGSHRRRAA
jgi:hypothetical protein